MERVQWTEGGRVHPSKVADPNIQTEMQSPLTWKKKKNYQSNFVTYTVQNMGLKLCLVRGVFNARYYFMQYNCGSCYNGPKRLSFDRDESVDRPRNPLSILSFGGSQEVNVLNLRNDHEKRTLLQQRMKRCIYYSKNTTIRSRTSCSLVLIYSKYTSNASGLNTTKISSDCTGAVLNIFS